MPWLPKIEAAAPAGAVAAAYAEWLRAFPAKLAARSVSWADLIAAAIVFHGHLGGVASEHIGARLHDELEAIAREGRPHGAGGPREVTARAGGQTGQLGFAQLTVRFEPRELDGAVVDNALEPIRLPEAYATAAITALGARAADHQLVRVRMTIVDALVHPIDATASAFGRAAAGAVDDYVGHPAPAR